MYNNKRLFSPFEGRTYKMAEFISHYLFGQEILPLMPKAAQNAATTYKAAFNW